MAALMAAGCDAAGGAEPEPDPAREAEQGDEAQADAAPDEAPTADAAREAAACAAVSDVMTIVENADNALREGRMTAQEQRGWYGVATRSLGRIPAAGAGAVSQGVADLQAAAPAVDAGAADEPAGIGTAAWDDALAALAEPCLAADAELTVSAFTGG
ncbi:hypothetical protein [Xylanimonas allomyrinae]|uniref:hypothetical protein n=1 Tax=Xylanimonas allomyrinae TaxID=2509459 RepID=UPI001B866142|nr:hypothetical protein [Xylanimonas allomyrinae]